MKCLVFKILLLIVNVQIGSDSMEGKRKPRFLNMLLRQILAGILDSP